MRPLFPESIRRNLFENYWEELLNLDLMIPSIKYLI